MPPSIYAIATMDTKAREIQFIADQLRESGQAVIVVDVGTTGSPMEHADVQAGAIAACHPEGADAATGITDRGEAVTQMSIALERFMLGEDATGKVSGVIGIGGSGGTALITPAMRALPIGLPKVMVSTVASGNVGQYVGCSDITMMYSVVDVAGINAVSRVVFGNAARAIGGMVLVREVEKESKQTVGMTMFGVTTPCVEAVRESLQSKGNDCLVFHATGTGGQAMEKLVASGMIQGVLDLTTTEVADEVVGGVFPAGPDRFDAILQARVPYVLSCGALDMVNFGAIDTVPEQFRDRNLYKHNAQVTLMRTTADENRAFALWISRKLNRYDSPFVMLLPEGGVSAIDAPGQPFHDPQADAALFEALERQIEQSDSRKILRLPWHINEPRFAEAAVQQYLWLSEQFT